MGNNIKYIDIKNRTYYVFDVKINIKNHDPNKIKIYEKSYRDNFIYIIGYGTFKGLRYVKTNSVNPSYLITLLSINKWVLWII